MDNELVSAEWFSEFDCTTIRKSDGTFILENLKKGLFIYIPYFLTCEKAERVLAEYGIQRKPKEPELKPCSVCQSSNIKIMQNESGKLAFCYNCFIRGTEYYYKEHTIEDWNDLPRQGREFPKYAKDKITNSIIEISAIEYQPSKTHFMNIKIEFLELPTAAEIYEYEAKK